MTHVSATRQPPNGSPIVLVDGVAKLYHLPRGNDSEGIAWPTLCGLAGGVYAYGHWAEEDRHCCAVCSERAPAGLLAAPKPRGKKRGKPKGKYRKLAEPQIRALHLAHWEQRIPINELGRRYWQKLGFASANGCANSLSKSFRDLGLPRHDRIAMCVQASTKHGMARRRHPKSGGKFGNGSKARGYKRWLMNERAGGETRNPLCSATTVKGTPCKHRALDGREVCFNHAPENAERQAAITAKMRSRSPLHNPSRIEPLAPLQEEMRAYFDWAGGWVELAAAIDWPAARLSKYSRTNQMRNISRVHARLIRDAIARLTAPEMAAAA